MKPQSKVGQYISCQTCQKPAGDHHTKKVGMCHACAMKVQPESVTIDNRDGDGQLYEGWKWADGLITFKRDANDKPVPMQTAIPFGWEPAPQWAKDAKAQDAAEERTRIGNTPAIDTDDDWPTCKHCGSNLADDDDVEEEVCDACQRDPQRWKTRTHTT